MAMRKPIAIDDDKEEDVGMAEELNEEDNAIIQAIKEEKEKKQFEWKPKDIYERQKLEESLSNVIGYLHQILRDRQWVKNFKLLHVDRHRKDYGVTLIALTNAMMVKKLLDIERILLGEKPEDKKE